MRYKITVRGTDIELRGYLDGEANLRLVAQQMEGIGLVIASPAEDDFSPFAISEPEHPPTPDASIDIIRGMWDVSTSPDDFLTQMAMMHFAQAQVIRGERGRAERAEKELLQRELHHFETEQENARLNEELAVRREDRGA